MSDEPTFEDFGTEWKETMDDVAQEIWDGVQDILNDDGQEDQNGEDEPVQEQE